MTTEAKAPCEHKDFAATVDVTRLLDSGRFHACVRIECAECHEPFRFIGLPLGIDLAGARMSADGLEARLAIAPESAEPHPLRIGEPMGFGIRPPVH